MSEAGGGASDEGTAGAVKAGAGADAGGAAGQGGYVLDASALLCLVNGEPGAERVEAVLSSAVISAVNLAEVATKLNELGADAEAARALLAPLHLAVAPFDEGAAFDTGALRAATRARGLSLGDRAALALAARRGAVALTADRAWADAGALAGVPVEMLR